MWRDSEEMKILGTKPSFPEAITLIRMIWAFKYLNGREPQTRFTNSHVDVQGILAYLRHNLTSCKVTQLDVLH